MSISTPSKDSGFFKFPFTDAGETDLNLSKNLQKLQVMKTPTRSQDDRSESLSGLVMGLSPIARNRDSGTSITSSLGSIDGQITNPDSVNSVGKIMEEEKAILSSPREKITNSAQGIDTGAEVEAKNVEQTTILATSNQSFSQTKGSSQSAMKEVGEHSSNFIDKIRDAAHKRKVAVTRSRDSLVAKEKEQLRSIAECKTRFAALKQKLQSAKEENTVITKENIHFQHNSLEGSLKHSRKNERENSGFGGVGVPKVEKRPTTTPLSPLLGLRRKGANVLSKIPKNLNSLSERRITRKPTSKHNKGMGSDGISNRLGSSSGQHHQNRRIITRSSVDKDVKISKSTVHDEEASTLFRPPGAFKARPVPPSTTRGWDAGQMGIPKVAKRAVTVPVSPCLGPKRHPQVLVEAGVKKYDDILKFKIKRNTSGSSNGLSLSSRSKPTSPSSVRSSPLIGLSFMNSIKKAKATIKGSHNSRVPTRKRTTLRPFVPRSTYRADIRNQYDVSHTERRALGLQEKREKLRSEIKVIHRELKILCKDLT